MNKLSEIALKVREGSASRLEEEELARQTILLAGARVKIIYKYKTLMEHQDATLETVERAFERMQNYWNPQRGAWSTYVYICARSVVRDRINKKARENKLFCRLSNQPSTATPRA